MADRARRLAQQQRVHLSSGLVEGSSTWVVGIVVGKSLLDFEKDMAETAGHVQLFRVSGAEEFLRTPGLDGMDAASVEILKDTLGR